MESRHEHHLWPVRRLGQSQLLGSLDLRRQAPHQLPHLGVPKPAGALFQSEDNGNIRTVNDYIDNSTNYAYRTGREYKFTNDKKAPGNINKAEDQYPNRSWFDYEGDTVVLRKTGGSFSFARPLNGGDPYKDSKWNVLAGMSFAEVRPINFGGESRPYGVSTDKLGKGKVNNDNVICVSYNCADSNTLVGMRFATTYNNSTTPAIPQGILTAGTDSFSALTTIPPLSTGCGSATPSSSR